MYGKSVANTGCVSVSKINCKNVFKSCLYILFQNGLEKCIINLHSKKFLDSKMFLEGN